MFKIKQSVQDIRPDDISPSFPNLGKFPVLNSHPLFTMLLDLAKKDDENFSYSMGTHVISNSDNVESFMNLKSAIKKDFIQNKFNVTVDIINLH